MQTTREILENGMGVGTSMLVYGKGMIAYKVRKVARKREGKHLYSILRVDGEAGGGLNCRLETVLRILSGEKL